MTLRSIAAVVERRDGVHRPAGAWAGVDAANVFLAHLESGAYSLATVRADAFDLVNFGRFLDERALTSPTWWTPTDLFDWIDWPSVRRPGGDKVL